ncbi:hypothetical protein BDN72DRAFT_955481 [Pluteus cervinus]|uniref:Uncharacterized protein n=1 Tax=Pluteus cervinus TaxID=181527 RepID=A0ACD3BAZ9_9AGAR|nr:hypothetical protein BDN72DRAFT_955481 [Pluteus cervinus]
MKYEDIQVAKIQAFLRSLLDSPIISGAYKNVDYFTMASLYGLDIESMDDSYVDLVERFVSMVSESASILRTTLSMVSSFQKYAFLTILKLSAFRNAAKATLARQGDDTRS